MIIFAKIYTYKKNIHIHRKTKKEKKNCVPGFNFENMATLCMSSEKCFTLITLQQQTLICGSVEWHINLKSGGRGGGGMVLLMDCNLFSSRRNLNVRTIESYTVFFMTNVEFVESPCPQSLLHLPTHISSCEFLFVSFSPPYTPVQNSRCIQGGVVQPRTGNKVLNSSTSAPGDLCQMPFPAADWRLSQRSGICQSCEHHLGRGQTCRPDPSALPVSACVLNRSSAKHWWTQIRPLCWPVEHQESRFNAWTLISSRRTTCC